MKTLGIDLAAQPKKTAACLVEWGDGVVRAEVSIGLDDDRLLQLIESAEKVGIDAPFGWPDAFVNAVAAHHRGEPWPPAVGDWSSFSLPLVFRATDLAVMEVRRPLSVSTDKIGVTALRCARLIDRAGVKDRSGTGKVAEVYPAAALQVWDYNAGRYKGKLASAALPAMVAALRDVLPVEVQPQTLVESNDDAFDALVAALVARAVALGLTTLPTDEVREQAQREGWIHVPTPGSLPELLR
jgi:predicted nuclease with RNAse H fold